jgi:long-chain acyl-CoA synthetase
MMYNLAIMLEYSAREWPDRMAAVIGNTHLSYTELLGATNQIANALLEQGIGRGDKVALSCPNLPYFPMVYYAILKTGATVVPLNVLLKHSEIAYHLQDSEAKAYLCFQGTPELPMAQEGFAAFKKTECCQFFWVITADPTGGSTFSGVDTLGSKMAGQSPICDLALTHPDDTAVILYTSGTTGKPKGAELSHANMVMNALITREMLHLVQDDVVLTVLPLFHSFGQTVLMNAGLSRGARLVFMPRFDVEAVLKTMQRESVTVFAGVPTMYWQMLSYKDLAGELDIGAISKNLRVGVSGAASLPVEIISGIESKYNIPILEGYGLSETSPVVAFNQLHKPRKPGSIGSPVWGVEVNIVDQIGEKVPVGEVGELVVRGHNVMKGYYRKPEATRDVFFPGGWLRTGDLCRMDDDGYYYIVDRVKEMIIRGGYNVYPREIEETLMTHPAVSLAAVKGVPHDQHGEEIKAYIVLKEGVQTTEKKIKEWAKKQMAAYKYPRIIEFRNRLPMTATGKILKKDLDE